MSQTPPSDAGSLDRRCGRRFAQQSCHRLACADENSAARRLQSYEIAFGTRHHRGEARPARGGLDGIVPHHEYFVELEWIDVRRTPDLLRCELLDILDAAFGHLLRRGAHDLEARGAAIDGARQIDERLRLVAVRLQPAMLGFRVGRAEAHDMHAAVARHQLAHALRRGRVVRRRKQLDVAVFQHHAAVRGADRALGCLLHRGGGDLHPQRLEHARGSIEVDDEVRNVVDVQLAGRGPLPVCDLLPKTHEVCSRVASISLMIGPLGCGSHCHVTPK
jgi:hypothetical protein